uniref:CSON015461 protein n=1 Tax=Culicoides sonorensis TaxID=179676 RepID=A0A336KT14_CULSO
MSNASACNNVIKLRGLPWNVSNQDIIDFLKDVEIKGGEEGIHLITSPKDGRPNGEAFVECANESDFDKAFDFNKKVMGHRYIEIFAAKPEEFEFTMRKQNIVTTDTFVKLRGLPYTCTVPDIERFFEGLELKNGRDSIIIMMDNRGRTSGEAFVQFSSAEETEKALKKNRDKIGHRYIEIFRSTGAEVRRVRLNNLMRMERDIPSLFDRAGPPRGGSGRNSRNIRDRPYDSPWGMRGRDFDDFGPPSGFGNGGGNFGNGNGGFADDFPPRGFGGGSGRGPFSDEVFQVHLRGMPFNCLEKDVYEFFYPLKPLGCDIIYNNRGRHSGEADAFFGSHDEAMLAMKKDKAKMGSRYIELFYNGKDNKGRNMGGPPRRF